MAMDGRLKELKGALKDVLAQNDAIVDHVEANREEGGPEVQVEAKHVEAFRSGLAKAREIRAEIEALEGLNEVKAWAAGSSAPAAASPPWTHLKPCASSLSAAPAAASPPWMLRPPFLLGLRLERHRPRPPPPPLPPLSHSPP